MRKPADWTNAKWDNVKLVVPSPVGKLIQLTYYCSESSMHRLDRRPWPYLSAESIALNNCYWAVQWSWFARVNALCNLSRKKSREVAASLPGRFLSRRWFTLCITMEVEPRIAKQYKCHHCYSCKNFRGKGMEGGKKVYLRRFLADQKIAISWNKCLLWHPIAWAVSYCLLPDSFWLRASKNAYNVGSVKFKISLSPPSIVKKVRTGSKSSQGT